tara:strand:- start:43 stop:402 length:360 start_codon:yes stop_codon:yes gene_type:complete
VGVSYWFVLRLQPVELERVIRSDARQTPGFRGAKLLQYESDWKSASVNVELLYTCKEESIRVAADLSLSKLGSRWLIVQVYNSNKSYENIEQYGDAVMLSLCAKHAVNKTDEFFEDVRE